MTLQIRYTNTIPATGRTNKKGEWDHLPSYGRRLERNVLRATRRLTIQRLATGPHSTAPHRRTHPHISGYNEPNDSNSYLSTVPVRRSRFTNQRTGARASPLKICIHHNDVTQ